MNKCNKEKKTIWTLSKLTTFVYQRTLSRKGKDNPQNRRKYLQIMCLVRINNWNT